MQINTSSAERVSRAFPFAPNAAETFSGYPRRLFDLLRKNRERSRVLRRLTVLRTISKRFTLEFTRSGRSKTERNSYPDENLQERPTKDKEIFIRSWSNKNWKRNCTTILYLALNAKKLIRVYLVGSNKRCSRCFYSNEIVPVSAVDPSDKSYRNYEALNVRTNNGTRFYAEFGKLGRVWARIGSATRES